MYELSVADKIEQDLPVKMSFIDHVFWRIIAYDTINYNLKTGIPYIVDHAMDIFDYLSKHSKSKPNCNTILIIGLAIIKLQKYLNRR